MTMIVRSVNVPLPADVAAVGPRLAPAHGSVEIGPAGVVAGAGAREIPGHDGLVHALYAYPTLHEPFWRTVRAQANVAGPDAPLPPAAFDEHLALDGLQESQLWLGDVLQFAGCALVVSAPRLPDARFNETLGFAHAAKMVAQSRWGGFWLAVRRPGRVAAGEAFELVPGPRIHGLVELFRTRIKGKTY